MKLFKPSQYPSEVHVGHETYKIRFVKRIPKQPLSVVGLADSEAKTIWIKANQSKQQLFRTYVHEICHALEFEYEIKIEHKEIYKFEEAIVQFLLSNY